MTDPQSDDEQCAALWHDQLNPNTPTYRCADDAGHKGPHHAHGTTWGTPTDWRITTP